MNRAHLEPGEVGGDGRLQVEQLRHKNRGERLADRAELEERLAFDRPFPKLGPALCSELDAAVRARDGDRHPGKAASLQEVAQPGQPVLGGEAHVRWTIVFLVIDCDIHPQIGDVEDFLGYVDPGPAGVVPRAGRVARDPRVLLGAPLLLVSSGHRAERPPACIRRGHGPPRAARPGRHRDRDPERGRRGSRLARCRARTARPSSHGPTTSGSASVGSPRSRVSAPRSSARPRIPQAAAAEIRRMAEDKRFVQVLLCGGADRPYGEPRYLPDLRGGRRVRAPCRDPFRWRGDGNRRASRRAPARSPSISSGTPSARPAASCPTSSRSSATGPSSACRV